MSDDVTRPHKLAEAMEGHEPAADPADALPHPSGPTHAEVAEQTRLQQESRDTRVEDRDDRLTSIGRGRDTAGRGSQK